MKLCPFCAEEIQDAAIVCKHCRRDLPAAPVARLPTADAASAPGGAPSNAGTPPSQRSQPDLLTAVGGTLILFGFLMPMTSQAAVGLGMLAAWIGFAMILPGSLVIRWAGGLILGCIVGGVGFAFSGSPPAPKAGGQAADSAPTARTTQPAPAVSTTASPEPATPPTSKPSPNKPAEPPSPWSYSEDLDDRTRKPYYSASVYSSNSINLDFPYQGEQHARLYIRKHPGTKRM